MSAAATSCRKAARRVEIVDISHRKDGMTPSLRKISRDQLKQTAP
jgi:hypothetical protein